MIKLRDVRAFEAQNDWESARNSLKSAKVLCPGDAEVILENAIVAEHLGGATELEWQRAAAALENRSKGGIGFLLGRFDGKLVARFGIDERELLVWSSNIRHPVVVDRSTARPVRIANWLSADPTWLNRDLGLVMSKTQGAVQVFDSSGRLLRAYPLPGGGVSTSTVGSMLSEESRTRLAWIPHGPRGYVLDLKAGKVFDPFHQSEFAPFFRGSPVATMSVSPSVHHWVLWKEPAPGEIDTNESANRSVVQVWDALTKKKLGQYPRQASDGIAVSEFDVVLYDYERNQTILWNVKSGKSVPLIEDREHRYSVASVLSDKKSVVLVKTPRSAPPSALGSNIVWTYGIGPRHLETQHAEILDATSRSESAVLIRDSGAPKKPSTDRALEVVSLDSGEVEMAVNWADSEPWQVVFSPQHKGLAIQGRTATATLSVVTGTGARLPYDQRNWSMAWLNEAEIGFANCGLEFLDISRADGKAPPRRIQFPKGPVSGSCEPIHSVDSGKWIAAASRDKLIYVDVKSGERGVASCGTGCKVLATSRISGALLVAWKQSSRESTGLGVFDLYSKRLVAESKAASRDSDPANLSHEQFVHATLQSPEGRWVALFSRGWIGVWDAAAKDAVVVRSMVPVGRELMRPLAASDSVLSSVIG